VGEINKSSTNARDDLIFVCGATLPKKLNEWTGFVPLFRVGERIHPYAVRAIHKVIKH
jgi:hypothetical protein